MDPRLVNSLVAGAPTGGVVLSPSNHMEWGFAPEILVQAPVGLSQSRDLNPHFSYFK